MSSQPPPLPPVNPYAAPAARVVDMVEDGDQVLAERGTRLAAKIIDYVIFIGVAMLGGAVGGGMLAGRPNDVANIGLFAIVLGVAMIAILVVNAVLLHRYGQTIAKRLFKIKIVRSDGSRCGLLRVIFLRWLPVTLMSYVVAFLLIAFGPFGGYLVSIGDVLLIFRDDYRCLHDHIADTIVVKA
jgi:uncharacterized RDD family membrane protein YckC